MSIGGVAGQCLESPAPERDDGSASSIAVVVLAVTFDRWRSSIHRVTRGPSTLRLRYEMSNGGFVAKDEVAGSPTRRPRHSAALQLSCVLTWPTQRSMPARSDFRNQRCDPRGGASRRCGAAWSVAHRQNKLTSHAVAAVDDIRDVVPHDDVGRRRTRLPRPRSATSPEEDKSRHRFGLGSVWLGERGRQRHSCRQKRTSANDWHVCLSGILRPSERHERGRRWRRASCAPTGRPCWRPISSRPRCGPSEAW